MLSKILWITFLIAVSAGIIDTLSWNYDYAYQHIFNIIVSGVLLYVAEWLEHVDKGSKNF